MYQRKSRLSNLNEKRIVKTLFSFLTTPLLLTGTGAAIAL
jgi:hypothetical protein